MASAFNSQEHLNQSLPQFSRSFSTMNVTPNNNGLNFGNEYASGQPSYKKSYEDESIGRFFGKGKGRGKWGKNFRPQCQICHHIGHIVNVCYYNFGSSIFHNSGILSSVNSQDISGLQGGFF